MGDSKSKIFCELQAQESRVARERRMNAHALANPKSTRNAHKTRESAPDGVIFPFSPKTPLTMRLKMSAAANDDNHGADCVDPLRLILTIPRHALFSRAGPSCRTRRASMGQDMHQSARSRILASGSRRRVIPRTKAEIAAAVCSRDLSVEEACKYYGLRLEDLLAYLDTLGASGQERTRSLRPGTSNP